MVDVKEAVAGAIQFASGVLGPDRTRDIRLEEVEIGEHKGQEVWFITLSMAPLPTLLGSPISDVLTGRGRREFKTFLVQKETGEVIAMKIRELTGA